MSSVGSRVASLIRASSHTQTAVGERVGLDRSAMSKSINGGRSFSSLELVQIADLLHGDVHWLVTGEPDPRRALILARHTYDPDNRSHENPSRNTDQVELQNIELAYRQVYADVEEPPALPRTADAIRARLGTAFVPDFVDRVEGILGIDVIRLLPLSTAYSLTICGRRIIAIPQDHDWYRANFDLAHEIGHFVLGHHPGEATRSTEVAANKFAAEVLLPADDMRRFDWTSSSAEQVGEFAWSHGVSTEALRVRLASLRIEASGNAAAAIALPTPLLISRHLDNGVRQLAMRRARTSQRRFPVTLQEHHLAQIQRGSLASGTYAWMLELGESEQQEIELPVPEADHESLAEALGW